MIQRLFDIVAMRSKDTPEAVMLAAKENNDWRTYTCKQVWDTANELAGGLLHAGCGGKLGGAELQEKVAIISPNRPEWMIADIGVQLTGAILTPVYPTISPNELAYILEEAEIKVVLVASADIYERFQEAMAGVPSVKYIYTFDKVEGVLHWSQLLKTGHQPDTELMAAITGDTLATIIYTSGTTGKPKGVMLTHKNIVSNCFCKLICIFIS
jgi:long-chain acyl-CoA synthetase